MKSVNRQITEGVEKSNQEIIRTRRDKQNYEYCKYWKPTPSKKERRKKKKGEKSKLVELKSFSKVRSIADILLKE